jgi:dienelactone hydrolase
LADARFVRPVPLLLFGLALALSACGPAFEPLDLPDDPAEPGVPVGVMTVSFGDQVMEVWYPAADGAADAATEGVDLMEVVPQVLLDVVDDFELPILPSRAVRDAPPRLLEEPVPALLFSHGMAGFRTQSFDVTTHLASRGYVVVAPDHPGRHFADLAPCLFDPPLDGCAVPDGSDPAMEDMGFAQDWLATGLEEVGLDGLIDLETRGIFGHSAGAGTSMRVGSYDPKIDAVLGLAGADDSFGGDVPLGTVAGTCDGMIGPEEIATPTLAAADGVHVDIAAAGHLAFTDLCAAEFGPLSDEVLAPRPDISATFLHMLTALGTDGCDGYVPAPELACGDAFMPLQDSAPLVRHYATVFFDEALKGAGPGVVSGAHEAAEVRP